MEDEESQARNKKVTKWFNNAYLFNLHTSAHTEDIEYQTARHDSIAANYPHIEVLTPKANIVLPCALFQQHLCTSGSKNGQYDEYVKHAMFDV